MKQLTLLLLLTVLLTALCGCQIPEEYRLELPFDPPSSTPQRMVEKVEIDLKPEDPLYHRVYQTQTTLNAMIQLIRRIELGDPLYHSEALNDFSSYYAFTVTYADGSVQVYRLLSHQYLRGYGDVWYEISRRNADELTQFILSTPSDDQPAPTEATDAAPETTVPPSSEVPATGAASA